MCYHRIRTILDVVERFVIPIFDVGDFKDTSREETNVTRMENSAKEICSSMKHLDGQELLALAITVGFSAMKKLHN